MVIISNNKRDDMSTLLISSGGGGAHKALAAYYSKRVAKGKPQLTFNIDFLEQPTERVKKEDSYLHITILNKLFNWIQSTGRGYWLRNPITTRFFISMIELFVYWRVKRNMLHMLRKHNASEVICAQPINLQAIYRALEQYAKENPSKQISYKICSTDYFSKAMPYWGGITSLPKIKPENLNVTVTGPYSESADRLESKTASWVKFDLKNPNNYEVEDGFYRDDSRVKRVIYTNSGIAWESRNITQATKILSQNNIQAHKFSDVLDVRPAESVVQTLGSQGSITLASQVSKWFKAKASKGSKLCIFAGKAYEDTIKELSTVFNNAVKSNQDEKSGDKTISTTVFSFGEDNSVQVVPFCSVSLINERMVKADTLVVKPSGQSTQQSVQLAISNRIARSKVENGSDDGYGSGN